MIKQATGTVDAAYWIEPATFLIQLQGKTFECEELKLKSKETVFECFDRLFPQKKEILYRDIDIETDTPQEGDEMLLWDGEWSTRPSPTKPFLPGNQYRRPIESKQE